MPWLLRWFNALAPLAAIAVVIVLWWGCKALFGIESFILPSPLEVVHAFAEDPRTFLIGSMESASAAAIGFSIAAVLGVLLASALSLSTRVERSVYPLTLFFQMVPLIAIAPLLVVWLGYGKPTIIASAAIVSIFPVIANTLQGLRSANPHLIELFQLLRASKLTTWWRLALPSAVPNIVTGLRISAGLASIGTIAGEFIAGVGGERAPLGVLVMTGLRSFRTDRVFVAVLLAALVGFVVFGCVGVLSRLLLRRWLVS